METAKPPVIIPMWLAGFDRLMPEGRAFPYKYLPRPGARLSVTFGDPIPSNVVEKALRRFKKASVELSEVAATAESPLPKGRIGDQVPSNLGKIDLTQKGAREERTSGIVQVRADVTAIVHDSVEALGRSVSGDTLSRMYTS